MAGGEQNAPRHRRLITAGVSAGVVVVALLAGTAATLAVAGSTPRPGWFLAAGAAVFVAVALGLGLARALARRGRRRGVASVVAPALVLLVLLAVALVPPSVPPTTPAPGTLVTLPDGAQLQVVALPAQGPVTGPPIVVLHGGPGIPELAANVAALGPLTSSGREVVLYAQRGAGTSTRLDDPRGYGREADVDDLEALRHVLGIDRMVLLGHSHGAAVAAAYTAAHRDRVDRLVLISPAPLDPADTSPTRAAAGLGLSRRVELYGRVLAPRALLGYLLLQTNPPAAHAFLGDAEADRRNDTVLTLAQPALFCHDPPPGTPPVTGSGFYALQYPQSATAAPPSDLRPAVAGLPTPALIVKGGCDYLSWRSALDYRAALVHAQVLYLPDAGHNAHHERPEATRAAVEAFLDGRSPSGTVIAPETTTPPIGYRGPH
ncbi:alpha/beta fold hydrolase [Actinomycetospora cinnamomea]|uniref:Pimeloyl-ACP methyl ester carboxylesterase n=1 Tax=Actinomycetospora cinnamomea TaxID=663609 RepID=A0A2U1E8Y7_9PSEU|nr:alpha/beta hydrolase [Actinomycetospora cinnamomea]PVY96342.1 pimeloyl-ACP methyl ester carboxylesterase [Actinomycetospora cinnamomea]